MFSRVLGVPLGVAARQSPVVTVTGPRQSGKTTLVRHQFPDHLYQSLEVPDLRALALSDPRAFLSQRPCMILDEIQRAPELLSYLQVMVDEDPAPGRFIVTGSQNLLLMESVSQTLAGRTALLRLFPLALTELLDRPALDPGALSERSTEAPPDIDLWQTLFTGFYPRIHDRGLEPRAWLADYFRTYVDRDLREIMAVADPRAFENFVRLAAARTGQELSFASLADDAGVARQTAKRWISALEIGFLVTTLPPHHENFRKRLRKRRKLHFLDSALVCYLLDIPDAATLARHPLRGAIFESFVVSELVKAFANRREDARLTYWRDATGREVDIIVGAGAGAVPIEVKSGSTLATDATKTLEWWSGLPGNPSEASVLVYGGVESYAKKATTILPWFLR